MSHGRFPGGGADPQIELGVVGLPDLVRRVGLAAVHQLEHLAVALGALGAQAHQPRVQRGDDVAHGAVARHRPIVIGGYLADLPVDDRSSGRGAAQRQARDQQLQLGLDSAAATVAALMSGQTGQPARTVRGQPALRGPQRHVGGTRGRGERHVVLEVRAQNTPPVQGDIALVVIERCELAGPHSRRGHDRAG
ncbi:hypothetical protein [Pseudonocardia broussonetiae]|uniref:hypothetical protein n=1 Tax=Pseudonocardia broussonetiae TaxID=2736640 RepID=UPI0019665FC2|nr:hypothetical protein [Pseudonocardia broussonetiae]